MRKRANEPRPRSAVCAGAGLLAFCLLASTPTTHAHPGVRVVARCERLSMPHPEELVGGAEVIVVARAVDASADESSTPWGGRVRFSVVEALRGRIDDRELWLEGRAVTTDHFNEEEPPYSWGREPGPHDECLAREYRLGALYLLMLGGEPGSPRLDWYPLGPVNEQLHGLADPWLWWVRGFVAAVEWTRN